MNRCALSESAIVRIGDFLIRQLPESVITVVDRTIGVRPLELSRGSAARTTHCLTVRAIFLSVPALQPKRRALARRAGISALHPDAPRQTPTASRFVVDGLDLRRWCQRNVRPTGQHMRAPIADRSRSRCESSTTADTHHHARSTGTRTQLAPQDSRERSRGLHSRTSTIKRPKLHRNGPRPALLVGSAVRTITQRFEHAPLRAWQFCTRTSIPFISSGPHSGPYIGLVAI